jgi:hypothetical protein
MSFFDRNSSDPSTRLNRHERRVWRGIAKRVAAEHQVELAARLSTLKSNPVADLQVRPMGISVTTLSGWQLALYGVAPSAAESLLRLAGQSCLIADGGRYGRFWWVRVAVGQDHGAAAAAVLGSHLRIDPIRPGAAATDPANPSPEEQLGPPLMTAS